MDGRDARAGSRLDIDEILNDLYASEINAPISWIWDGGFYVTLGNPKQAEGLGLPEHLGEAVAWLRDQAIVHYPDSEFARKYAQKQRG
jgi:hypothetical protein